MSPHVLCSDCPECHSEVTIKLGMAPNQQSPGGESLYRITCVACGCSYDARFEDLIFRNKTEDEIKASQAVTTFAWR